MGAFLSRAYIKQIQDEFWRNYMGEITPITEAIKADARKTHKLYLGAK